MAKKNKKRKKPIRKVILSLQNLIPLVEKKNLAKANSKIETNKIFPKLPIGIIIKITIISLIAPNF